MTCRQEVAKFFPELTGYLHKGMLGRITVVGGCDQYTGAPYFAASAALRVGADLVSVLCTEEAAVPIKCYSPDIMVLGRLTKYAEHEAAQRLVSKADCVVIGTGLGLDPKILEVARNILIHRSSSEKKAIVVDGDGIMCVVRKPKLLQGNNRAILTPNAMEFRRLWEAIFPKEEAPPFDVTIEQKDQLEFVDPEFDPDTIATSKLARALGGVVVVRKGIVDVISDGKFAAHCGVTGSPRRVGGQGDVLCGVMGVFNHWAAKSPCPGVLAASAACALTRIASRKAYAVNKRSMLTSDILNCVGDAVEEMASSFPSS